MTTAARPTWDTAKGGTGKRERDLSAMSNQYSARDLASHTKLKSRSFFGLLKSRRFLEKSCLHKK